MEDVIVIGSGPAGLTAAIYLARAGYAPLTLEGSNPGGQLMQTSVVENYPGFSAGVDGFSLMQEMRQQADRFGARFLQDELRSVDFNDANCKRLFLKSGQMLESRAAVIAAGASPIRLNVEGEERLVGRGVSFCATCDGGFFRGQVVAVVGGGDTACEEALTLAKICPRVFLLHRRNELRASKIMSERVLANPVIECKWGQTVTRINGTEQVESIDLHPVDGGADENLKVSALFVAIGHAPNSAPFAGQLALADKQGHIQVDATATSVPGIFAAGDICSPHDKQAVIAAGQGAQAALAAERYLQLHS
ncbi:MAG: thioredoxin-disulfide reductase [Kiritimatiellia bacterium]